MPAKYATYADALKAVQHAVDLMPHCRPGQAYCNTHQPEEALQIQIYYDFGSVNHVAAIVYNYYQFNA